MGICLVDGCNNKTRAKGLCPKHYEQTRRHGRLTPEVERQKKSACFVKDCTGTYYAKGYCYKHYKQIYRLKKLVQKNKKI